LARSETGGLPTLIAIPRGNGNRRASGEPGILAAAVFFICKVSN
jgi:hypothetical protein